MTANRTVAGSEWPPLEQVWQCPHCKRTWSEYNNGCPLNLQGDPPHPVVSLELVYEVHP